MKERRPDSRDRDDADHEAHRAREAGKGSATDDSDGAAHDAPASSGGDAMSAGSWEPEDAWPSMMGDEPMPPQPSPDAPRGDKPIQKKAKKGFEKAPKDQRLHADPHQVKMKAEIHGTAPSTTVILRNPGDATITISGVIQQAAGGTHRPVGDFQLAGLTEGTPVPASGAAPPLVVTFQPQVHFAEDTEKTTKRKVKVNVVDTDRRVIASVRLDGTAKPPDDDTREKYAHGAVKEASHKHTKLSPPHTYAEMLRYLEVAAEHIGSEAYDDALPSLRAVQKELEESASPAQVDSAMRNLGYPTDDARRDMDLARGGIENLIAVATEHVSMRVETQLDNFRGAEQLLKLMLGEVASAPAYADEGSALADAARSVDSAVRFLNDPARVIRAGGEILEKTAEITEEQIKNDPVLGQFTEAEYDAGLLFGAKQGCDQAIADLRKQAWEALKFSFKLPGLLLTKGWWGVAGDIAAEIEEIIRAVPKLLAEFGDRWNNDNLFLRGYFRGQVMGYLMTQVAIAVLTDMAAAELIATGMFAEFAELFETSGGLATTEGLAETTLDGTIETEEIAHASRTAESADEIAEGEARLGTIDDDASAFEREASTSSSADGEGALAGTESELPPSWHSDAKLGQPATAETIEAETVAMEDHPDYEARLQLARDKGYEVVSTSGAPHVEIIEIIDEQGNVIATNKKLYLRPKMRFLDLEHEMGHIEQLDRLGHPPMKRMIQTESGALEKASGNALEGIFTKGEDRVAEYHNRLREFVRLKDKAPRGVLDEELVGLEQFRIAAENKSGLGRSPAITEWAKQYFPEIPDLEQAVRDAGFALGQRTSRW